MTSDKPLSPPATPWHAGELALQSRAGVVQKMDELGRRVVRAFLTEQHRAFFPLLPMIVVGVATPDGYPWATMLAGWPGFLASPNPRILHVQAWPSVDDPATAGIFDGAAVGLLGIEMSTRRRNRVNGVVRASPGSFDLDVLQSFGNCDRFIQARDFVFVRQPGETPVEAASPERTVGLTARASEMIAAADTFFVASFVDLEDGRRQVDVSHRGGRTGFVRVDDTGTLTVPDFAGNLFFNTLGNFLVNPKAGLLFCNFHTGDLLQLSGAVEVILESPEIASFEGAEQLWRFCPEEVVLRERALPIVFRQEPDSWSSATLMTGDWPSVAAQQRAAAKGADWRPFRIERIVDESSVIRSFHLQPADGAPIVKHRAGQYLPIRVRVSETEAPLVRHYTVSTSPFDGFYRISVRRDGRVSRHLHDWSKAGDLIEARAPAGTFTIDALAQRPVVLMSAGIGITPMLAMLRQIVFEGARARRTRPTWLFAASRSLDERAFDDELAALAGKAEDAVHVVRVLRDVTGARPGEHYELEGRLTVDMVRSRLPFDDCDFYICGPFDFMRAASDDLRARDVAPDRIHLESFGGALPRAVPVESTRAELPAVDAVPVIFVASGKEAQWEQGSGSLLEFAERCGLAPEFGCREGVCGTCKASVREGRVAYSTPPGFQVGTDEVLLCWAVPARGVARLLVDI